MLTHQARDILMETEALFERHRRPGLATCLGCSHLFTSWHVVKNRLCAGCTRRNERGEYEWGIKA